MISYSSYQHIQKADIRWLEFLTAHWHISRLKHIAHINALTLPNSTRDNLSIQYVDIGNVTLQGLQTPPEELFFGDAPSRARRIVQPNDTIVSTVRTYLKAIAFFENPPSNLIVSTGFAVLTPSEDVVPKFLYYQMRAPRFINDVMADSVGVSYPAINPSDLANLPIWLPPLPEQRAIADFLDRETAILDELIAKKRELIERLQEKRIALISHAVTKGLDPDVKMKDSGVEWLGEIPAHWEVSRIKWIVETPVTDGPHKTPELLDDGIPFISAEAIKNNKIDFSRKRGYISIEEHHRYSKKYKPRKNDIYMVKSGATTGNVAIVETEEEFNIWSPLAAIRPNTNITLTTFVFFFMQSLSFFQAVESSWNFGTQQNIGMRVIENIATTIPPISEQLAITTYLEQEASYIDALVEKIEQAIDHLQEYRTALISAAVTGKIDVRG